MASVVSHVTIGDLVSAAWWGEFEAVAPSLYWKSHGKYQAALEAVNTLLPVAGGCSNDALNTLRVFKNVYYDVFNNGNRTMRCNQRRDQLLEPGIANYQGLQDAALDGASSGLVLTPMLLDAAMDDAITAAFAAAWPHASITDFDVAALPPPAVCANPEFADDMAALKRTITPPFACVRVGRWTAEELRSLVALAGTMEGVEGMAATQVARAWLDTHGGHSVGAVAKQVHFLHAGLPLEPSESSPAAGGKRRRAAPAVPAVAVGACAKRR